ncbi:MAG: endonuclease/exonuclease/phosphatase family protein [Bacteroidota bacterium]
MRCLLICLCCCACFVQACAPGSTDSSQKSAFDATGGKVLQKELPAGTQLAVAFYNVENLFDTKDNPQTNDQDFLPEGRYQWTEENLDIKLSNLASVIGKIGEGGPALLGVAEVENRDVLTRLASHELIRSKNYEIVHDDSPDERGIDVGFIYDPEVFQLKGYEPLIVSKSDQPGFKTREILMVNGEVNKLPVYVFINHWPSRREGKMESQPNRLAAAHTLRKKVDEVRKNFQEVGIIIMGDFNDDPIDTSIKDALGAQTSMAALEEDALYNATFDLFNPDNSGSLTYKGKWNLFDQIILSEDLMDGEHSLSYMPQSAKVYKAENIRVPNRKTKFVPRRAIFRGEFQEDGYSDHFPVYLKLYVN